MNCPSQQPFLRAGTEGRELPEATGNRSQVQVGQNGASRPVEGKSAAFFVLAFISGISLGGTCHAQVLKFQDNLERVGWRAHRLCDLVDSLHRGVAEKLGSDSDVRDSGVGSSPMSLAQVASAATGSSASTIRLSGRGCHSVVRFLPLPQSHRRSRSLEPASVGGANVEDHFPLEFLSNEECFFGQPYFAPGTTTEHCFSC